MYNLFIINNKIIYIIILKNEFKKQINKIEQWLWFRDEDHILIQKQDIIQYSSQNQ